MLLRASKNFVKRHTFVRCKLRITSRQGKYLYRRDETLLMVQQGKITVYTD